MLGGSEQRAEAAAAPESSGAPGWARRSASPRGGAAALPAAAVCGRSAVLLRWPRPLLSGVTAVRVFPLSCVLSPCPREGLRRHFEGTCSAPGEFNFSIAGYEQCVPKGGSVRLVQQVRRGAEKLPCASLCGTGGNVRSQHALWDVHQTRHRAESRQALPPVRAWLCSLWVSASLPVTLIAVHAVSRCEGADVSLGLPLLLSLLPWLLEKRESNSTRS